MGDWHKAAAQTWMDRRGVHWLLTANDRSANRVYFQVEVVVVVVVVVVVEVVVVVVVLLLVVVVVVAVVLVVVVVVVTVVVAVSMDSLYVQLSREVIRPEMHRRLGACRPERPSCLGVCFLSMLHKESGVRIRNQNQTTKHVQPQWLDVGCSPN
jgi:ABC-type multidrug transport system fused ATPase/permease subunit